MVFDIDKKSVDTVLNFNWYITPYYVTAIIAFVFLGIIFSLTSQSSADFYQPSFTSRYTAWVVLWIILAWLRIFKEQLAYRTQDKLRKYRKARGIKEVKDSRHERPI